VTSTTDYENLQQASYKNWLKVTTETNLK